MSADTIAPVAPLPPWPAWFEAPRSWQTDAAAEIMDAFNDGARVVVLDGPTGAGKTAIAEMVRRELYLQGLAKRTQYTCTTKSLQDQFLRSFPYAYLLKGKANYIPLDAPFDVSVTCADCDRKRDKSTGKVECTWCDNTYFCPYQVAKRRAVQAALCCTNTAYALNEWNGGASRLTGADLVIIDECHELEDAMLSYCEFRVTARQLNQYNLTAPKKGSHQSTIKQWMREQLLPEAQRELARAVENAEGGLFERELDVKEQRRLRRLAETVGSIYVTLERMERGEWIRVDSETADGRRRGDGYAALTLKPVTVDEHGPSVLWAHGKRFLLMSATVISAAQRVEETGVPEDWRWHAVYLDSPFEPERRPVHYAGVAVVTRKNGDAAVAKVCAAVVQLARNHPEDRILVHSVSYALADNIATALDSAHFEDGTDRTVITYRDAQTREMAVAEFRSTLAAIMVAPSLDTGVDFPDDDCRVQIIAKLPFPNLGDKQIGARANQGFKGQQWYNVKTIETIVQATGRAMRHEGDWCDSYILDKSFSHFYQKNKRLFPGWWRDAVDMRFNRREAGLSY